MGVKFFGRGLLIAKVAGGHSPVERGRPILSDGLIRKARGNASMLERPAASAEQAVEQWMRAFNLALAQRDNKALAALFLADSHWRNLFGISWQLVTFSGRETLCNELGHRAALIDEAFAAMSARLYPETKSHGLSFADRACLALGLQRNCKVLTSERRMALPTLSIKVKLIRNAN